MLDDKQTDDDHAMAELCREFISGDHSRRGVFGRNEYAESVAGVVDVDFFVDDFTDDDEYLGKPVITTENIPVDSIIVSAVVLGRPLTAQNKLTELGLKNISYYAFHRYSGLVTIPVKYCDEFTAEYKLNKVKFDKILDLLSDEESKRIFKKLVNFKLSGDLSYMDGFIDRQKEQYFEDFLGLQENGEVFADVGGFDGFTTQEFIKRCPRYNEIYFFEPELKNMKVAKSRLSEFDNIHYIQKGLSNKNGLVRFSVGGSASVISEAGEVEIAVDMLDNIVNDEVTYIKMDIEGAEGLAIDGAKGSISNYHPRLAISVYHKADDFWKLPEQVFAIRNDYRIYLRHYTEGIDETVMFFIPV